MMFMYITVIDDLLTLDFICLCSDFQISVDGETEEQSTSNEEVEEFFVKYKNL